MPIIAESPPLIFGGTGVPTVTGTPQPKATKKPKATKRPTTTPPQAGETSQISASEFVNKHKFFINTIDALSTCFSRDDMPEFADDEFADHIEIAKTDRYVVSDNETFCTMQAINNLKSALRRIGE